MCWDFNFGGRGISALLFASFSLTFFPGLHIFKSNGLIEIWVSTQGTLNQLMKPEVICLLNQLILLNLVKGPLYLNIIYIVKFNCKPNSILKKILGLHFNNINIAKCTSYKKVKKNNLFEVIKYRSHTNFQIVTSTQPTSYVLHI